MNEKMLKIMGGVIAGFVVLIIMLFLISSCSKTKYTYEKLQTKMLKVAKEYYKNNEDKLPIQDGTTASYTLKKMISDGSIEELSELFDDDSVKCNGEVTVTNNNGYYLYTPSLTCGNDYQTTLLADKIKENVVETGVGLYEVGDNYIFKGEVTNNYISWNDETYRIIRINDDNTIRVFKVDGLKQQVWDNRYNEDSRSSDGLNEYVYNDINSRVKDSIESIYKDDFTDEEKAYIVTQNLCIGKRTESDITKDGSTECSVKLEGQQLGLITTYEFLQATLDTDCQKTTDKACLNYNWLSFKDLAYWTMTANADSTKQAYIIYKYILRNNCSSYSTVNVVFNLDSKLIYTSGTGTEEDPYIIG